VEDLISTGGSSLLAVEALRNEGANIKGMAFQANARTFNWTDDSSEAISEAVGGMLISNHSYGVPITNNGVTVPSWFIGAYSSDMYVRATSIVDSSDYFEGTLVVPSVGDPYLFPSITSGNFSTGSVKLSVVGVPGADGVDGDGFSSTNVVSNVFMSGYTLNGSVDNIGAYQVGQFVRLTVTSDDAVNPWIPVGDWIEGEVRAVNGIGVSIHINGAKPGIVGQYISGNLGTSRDTQFSMSVRHQRRFRLLLYLNTLRGLK
jgi:hypothetical protein